MKCKRFAASSMTELLYNKFFDNFVSTALSVCNWCAALNTCLSTGTLRLLLPVALMPQYKLVIIAMA